MALAAQQCGDMSAKDATLFASAFLTSMEGAFVVSKAQGSSAPHLNAARAIKALANALRQH
jgi:imidazoleglycerol phosphate dehydratase HisB